MSSPLRVRLPFFVIAFLQIVVVLFLQIEPLRNTPSVVCYFALVVLNLLQYFSAKRFEDLGTTVFVNAALGLTAAIGLIAGLGPAKPIFANWYVPPLMGSNVLAAITIAPEWLQRLAIPFAYLITAYAVSEILRTLERRPSLLLLYAMSPVAITILIVGNSIFLPMACITLSMHFLIKRNWLVSIALLGFGTGLGLIGVLLLALFIKHQCEHTPSADRMKATLIGVIVFVAVATLSTLPIANIEWTLFGCLVGLSTSRICVSIVTVILGVAFIYKAQVPGKDTVLYVCLLLLTLLIISALDSAPGLILLLLSLAAIFRSLPHLWYFIAGVGLEVIQPHYPPYVTGILVAIFAILMYMQLRHAVRETGLFRTIELRES